MIHYWVYNVAGKMVKYSYWQIENNTPDWWELHTQVGKGASHFKEYTITRIFLNPWIIYIFEGQY